MNPETPFKFFSAKVEGRYWKTEKHELSMQDDMLKKNDDKYQIEKHFTIMHPLYK